MKQITRVVLEESDIDLNNDPLHKLLIGGIAVGALLMASKPTEGKTFEDMQKTAVVTLLNLLDGEGFVIVRKEPSITSLFLGGAPEGL